MATEEKDAYFAEKTDKYLFYLPKDLADESTFSSKG
jgi:hypothetical protein